MTHRSSCVLLALALVASCGKDETSIKASVRVDGTFVVVEVSCPGATSVRAAGASEHCSKGSPAVIRIPADTFGAGTHKIMVEGEMTSLKPTKVELTVDIPASALGPSFTVEDCAQGPEGDSMDLKVGDTAFSCRTSGGARAKLTGRASPRGKLTIGAKTIDVPDSGKYEVVADLSGGILALTIDDLVSRNAEPAIVVPWKVDAGGKQIEGTLAFSLKYGGHRKVMGQWLRDVVDGKIDRPVFTPRTEGRHTAVRAPTGDQELIATDRRGTVRELGLIAIDRETKRTQDGVCRFDSTQGSVTATRYGVELEVKVVSTADGKVVATRTFPPGKGCPTVALLDRKKPEVGIPTPDTEISAWIDTLTAVAPAPADPAAAPAPAGSP